MQQFFPTSKNTISLTYNGPEIKISTFQWPSHLTPTFAWQCKQKEILRCGESQTACFSTPGALENTTLNLCVCPCVC